MRKIKVYKCEFTGRYTSGMSIVAAKTKPSAIKLTREWIENGWPRHYTERMVVSELRELQYTGGQASFIAGTHYVE